MTIDLASSPASPPTPPTPSPPPPSPPMCLVFAPSLESLSVAAACFIIGALAGLFRPRGRRGHWKNDECAVRQVVVAQAAPCHRPEAGEPAKLSKGLPEQPGAGAKLSKRLPEQQQWQQLLDPSASCAVREALFANPSLDDLSLVDRLCATGSTAAADAVRESLAVRELCNRCPGSSLPDARRFLRARQANLHKAEVMLRADLEWRSRFRPEAVSQADVPTAMATGCWRSLGPTGDVSTAAAGADGPAAAGADGTVAAAAPEAYMILWVQVGLWRPHLYSVDEYTKFVIYFLERLSTERFIVMFDMSGWSLSAGAHLRKVAALISTLQDHYPERLELALMLRCPGIFAATWRLIKPMIDQVTANKVCFVKAGAEGERAEMIARSIPLAVVPSIYGGTVDAAAIPCPNIAGEPNVAVMK